MDVQAGEKADLANASKDSNNVEKDRHTPHDLAQPGLRAAGVVDPGFALALPRHLSL